MPPASAPPPRLFFSHSLSSLPPSRPPSCSFCEKRRRSRAADGDRGGRGHPRQDCSGVRRRARTRRRGRPAGCGRKSQQRQRRRGQRPRQRRWWSLSGGSTRTVAQTGQAGQPGRPDGWAGVSCVVWWRGVGILLCSFGRSLCFCVCIYLSFARTERTGERASCSFFRERKSSYDGCVVWLADRSVVE